MRKLILFQIFIFISAHYVHSQPSVTCENYKEALNTYQNHAYKVINKDSVSGEKIVRAFIQSFDPNGVHFNSDDTHKLSSLELALNTNYKDAYCSEKNSIEQLIKNCLENSQQILRELNKSVFDFELNDSVCRLTGIKDQYYVLDKEKRWRNFIKLRTLSKVVVSTSKFDSIQQNHNLLTEELEKSKKQVINQELKRITRILGNGKELEEYIYVSLINSILTQIDPHCNYISKDIFSEFKDQLSDFSNSYGVTIEYNQDKKFVVSSIIPGSSAWRTGTINVGDVIVSFGYENVLPLDLEYADPFDLNEYLSEHESDKLTMVILDKFNKKIETVLVKEKIKNTENSVQAFILEGKMRTGYIILPAFYTTWESDNRMGCAQDVAMAIYQLNSEGIEALIIDLRNNGGGSMQEAIELAGIFIDYGVLTIERDRDKELRMKRDNIRGTMYSKPLAILVNQSSASASELVSAVLQDYNRAIIIGSKTFGKATVQTLMPVGVKESELSKRDYINRDIIKLTIAKFYRINGKSHQRVGVTPDIILPSLTALHSREVDYDGAFSNDSISKKIFIKPLAEQPLTRLKELSNERVDASNKFQLLLQINSDMKTQLNRLEFTPLSINKFYNQLKEYELIEEKIEIIQSDSTNAFSVLNLKSDAKRIELYEHYKLLDKGHKISIFTDPYIEETYNVLIDYKNLTN